MKNRYIDFVPITHTPKSPAHPNPSVTVTVEKQTVQLTTTPAVAKEFLAEPEPAPEEIFEPTANTFEPKPAPKLGIVEDYQPINPHKKTIFTNTNVAKRPLFAPRRVSDLSAIKAEKVSRKPLVFKKTAKPVGPAKPEFSGYQMPKNPFINTAVEKRPLSKNVYKPNIPTTSEEETSPVRIIEKPQKESKAGIVVTIILTIILGAAVGTVAFLLLPR